MKKKLFASYMFENPRGEFTPTQPDPENPGSYTRRWLTATDPEAAAREAKAAYDKDRCGLAMDPGRLDTIIIFTSVFDVDPVDDPFVMPKPFKVAAL